MVKYAVVDIYGLPGTKQTHSKPTKTYDSIKAVRVAAMRQRKLKNGKGWIVKLYADNSASIVGQVWNLDLIKYHGYKGWVYEDKTGRGVEKMYILNIDGTIGRRL